MAKKRYPQKTIFIACEGKNTEPLYFEKIQEIKEDDEDYPYSITIYPDREEKKPKTDAVGLVCEAINRKKEYDELWVVFDKDGYTKHKEAFKLAQENNINIAFSSISFEMWVLLHFEKSSDSYEKSIQIIESKFLNNEMYFPSYSKSNEVNIFPFLENKTQNACINAAWLRANVLKNNPSVDIFELNPYTDIDYLVKMLLQISTSFFFCEINETFEEEDFFLKITLDGNSLKCELHNKKNIALVSNQFRFLLYDGSVQCSILIKNEIINPTDSLILDTDNDLNFDCIKVLYKNLILCFPCRRS